MPRTPPPPPAQAAIATLAEVDVVFHALAHESRRHILLLLAHLGGELPSGYLAARFQHSWPTTTRHLGVLVKAGLVEVRREGRTAAYCLNRERLDAVVAGWMRHLEPVDPARTWTAKGARSTAEMAAARGRDEDRSPRARNPQARNPQARNPQARSKRRPR